MTAPAEIAERRVEAVRWLVVKRDQMREAIVDVRGVVDEKHWDDMRSPRWCNGYVAGYDSRGPEVLALREERNVLAETCRNDQIAHGYASMERDTRIMELESQLATVTRERDDAVAAEERSALALAEIRDAQNRSGPNPVVATGHDGKPWPQTLDGMAWAIEFNKRFPAVSVDDALGWFCNAIMAALDEGARKLRAVPLAPTRKEITAALASLSKAWPVLVEHASHIDGEFDHAMHTVRRYIERTEEPQTLQELDQGSVYDWVTSYTRDNGSAMTWSRFAADLAATFGTPAPVDLATVTHTEPTRYEPFLNGFRIEMAANAGGAWVQLKDFDRVVTHYRQRLAEKTAPVETREAESVLIQAAVDAIASEQQQQRTMRPPVKDFADTTRLKAVETREADAWMVEDEGVIPTLREKRDDAVRVAQRAGLRSITPLFRGSPVEVSP